MQFLSVVFLTKEDMIKRESPVGRAFKAGSRRDADNAVADAVTQLEPFSFVCSAATISPSVSKLYVLVPTSFRRAVDDDVVHHHPVSKRGSAETAGSSSPQPTENSKARGKAATTKSPIATGGSSPAKPSPASETASASSAPAGDYLFSRVSADLFFS